MKQAFAVTGSLSLLVAVLLAGCGGGGSGSSGDTDNGPVLTDTTWVPGVSVGPVAMGENYASVKADLGEPSHMVADPDNEEGPEVQVVYQSLGLGIFFTDSDGDGQADDAETVHSIVLMPDYVDHSTVPESFRYNGLGLGSPHADVIAVMGPPRFDDANSSFYTIGVMFAYGDSNLVDGIVVRAP